MGIVYLAGFYVFFACMNAVLLAGLKPITPMGTKKTPARATIAETTKSCVAVIPVNQHVTTVAATPEQQAIAVQVEEVDRDAEFVNLKAGQRKAQLSSKQSFQLTALPFVPVTLTWRHINYSVEVGTGKEKHWRQLLTDISGFAAPGRMTALMGSSGAGKTTLMDVVAGRKTVGRIEGEILVNGHPKESDTFAKLAAYVEQNDIHIGTATVREALLFSAKLRLPTSVDDAARVTFVDEVMALVGLTNIRDRLIGDAAIPGLSPGQLKLVTIGVELVANPSVIFLDEPTSGLDAPSAARVMSAVRRIAATGRTVLCTIHQPSEQLFLMFDRLLLLKTGGRDVFFSDCGHKGNNLVNYFEQASGYTEKLPRGGKTILPDGTVRITLKINPANWMLDVIGAAGNKGENQLEYATIWRESELFKDAEKETLAAAMPKSASKITLDNQYASSWTRFLEVQRRLIVSHWRNPPMNLTRMGILLFLGLMFGLIYLKVSTDTVSGISSFLGVIFLGLSFPSSFIAASPIPSLFRARAVYYRETTIGLFGLKTFSVTIFIAELPYIVMSVFLFLIPYYFLVSTGAGITVRFATVLVWY